MLNPWLHICTCFESAKVIPLLKHQLISNILTVLHIDSFRFWHLCMYSYIYNHRSRSLLGCRPCYCIHKQQLKGKCNRIEELLTFIEFEINVGINLMKLKAEKQNMDMLTVCDLESRSHSDDAYIMKRRKE